MWGLSPANLASTDNTQKIDTTRELTRFTLLCLPAILKKNVLRPYINAFHFIDQQLGCYKILDWTYHVPHEVCWCLTATKLLHFLNNELRKHYRRANHGVGWLSAGCSTRFMVVFLQNQVKNFGINLLQPVVWLILQRK